MLLIREVRSPHTGPAPGWALGGFLRKCRSFYGDTPDSCRLSRSDTVLADTVNDKTEAAYRRGDLLDKRRELMATWASFATSKQADVVALRAV